MVKYLYIFILLGVLILTSCSDDSVEQPHALSVHLNSLANTLDTKTTCDEKAETISFWMVTYKDDFESELDSFKQSCPVGKSSSYKCMSHQLLSSGRVEVALNGCRNHDRVKSAVAILNERAGIAIYKD